jgi:hypothetical protein
MAMQIPLTPVLQQEFDVFPDMDGARSWTMNAKELGRVVERTLNGCEYTQNRAQPVERTSDFGSEVS